MESVGQLFTNRGSSKIKNHSLLFAKMSNKRPKAEGQAFVGVGFALIEFLTGGLRRHHLSSLVMGDSLGAGPRYGYVQPLISSR